MKWTDTAPDLAEPILAARLWRTTPGTGSLRALRSLVSDETWPNHRMLEASCSPPSSGGWMFGGTSWLTSVTTVGTTTTPPTIVNTTHEAPAKDCGCGVWGLCSPLKLFELARANVQSAPIFGVVELWGRVVYGPDGWRGQYARLNAVVARNPQHVRNAESQVSQTYSVPLLTDWPELAAPFPSPEPEETPEPETATPPVKAGRTFNFPFNVSWGGA